MIACSALEWSLEALARIDWLDVIKSLAAVATVVIAYRALRNWQKQDKAKRQAEFLDALLETTHAFGVDMTKPTQLLSYVRIGMMSHAPVGSDYADETERIEKGAIAYIKKNGKEDSTRLFDALNEARAALIKLRALGAKGLVFRFKDYADCQLALATLTKQYDRVSAVASIVGSPTLNWQHPEVQSTLVRILTVEPEDVNMQINDSHARVLGFAQAVYARLYG